MLRSPRLHQFLRQKPFRDSILQATLPRTFVRSTPLRQRRDFPQQRFITSARPPLRTTSRWSWRNTFLQRFRNIRYNSTKQPSPNPTSNLGSPEPQLSLSQRMRKLSREYGWSAVGVYLALSALDLPFCFLAVRLAGPERIGHIEHAILNFIWNTVGTVFPSMKWKPTEATPLEVDGAEAATTAEEQGMKHTEQASIWTQLALAYGIHKTLLIFVRVPLTAAITPKVVKTLRGWGWNIGKRRPKVKAQ